MARDSLELTCLFTPVDVLTVDDCDGDGDVRVAIAQGGVTRCTVFLDPAAQRQLFNWLGVQLHTR